jgi:protein-tyrosine phosphatase
MASHRLLIANDLATTEVQKTFEELEWHQRKRWAEGMRKTAPGAKPSQWAGLSGAEIVERNRYTNIYPWQSNRVKLEVQEGQSDYINASPITLKCTRVGNVKRYIATQVCLPLFDSH